MAFEWTEVRVEELKALHAEGLSYSLIAERLGDGLTRSAISGKIDRLGMSRGRDHQQQTTTQQAMLRRTMRKPSPAQQKFGRKDGKPKPPMLTAIRTVEQARGPEPLLIPLAQLSAHTCKWPIGTPGEEGGGFCGNHTAEGRPYCGFHCAKAYQAPDPRRGVEALMHALRRYA